MLKNECPSESIDESPRRICLVSRRKKYILMQASVESEIRETPLKLIVFYRAISATIRIVFHSRTATSDGETMLEA